ncbi:MAG: hypothetical protein GX237_00075, partial [Clostridiales bacterium]|nr:hypothetical protein [Clostridiales bacterium]
MNRRIVACFALIALLIPISSFGNAIYASTTEDNTITEGVFIEEIDVSGLTAKEAKEAVNDYVNELKGKEISFKVNDNIVTATLGDLGYTYVPNGVIDEALALGTKGNLIKRYKEIKDIAHGGKHYKLEFTVDEHSIRQLVSTELIKYNVDPINASVSRKDGKMIYTDHVLGKSVDVEATILLIKDWVLNSWDSDNLIVEVVMEDVTPIYTRDIVEQCDTILGSFKTEYADSAQGRAANLANGARLINNTVLYPGEVFSGYEHLSPFNKENGYYVAGAYSKGKIIDSVGGGACQVTTTLYNAALEAELEIIERQAHSMTISYVSLSRDAAIAGTYKDLKFKNNTDVPILIEAYTKGRSITFNIWGNETRDTANRKIKFETHVLSETPPPKDVIEEDPTKPITYRKVTQSAHTGYRTELYKVVYENDIEVSRTLINKSNYSPAPRYIIIGTKEPEKVPEDTQASNNDDLLVDDGQDTIIEDDQEDNLEDNQDNSYQEDEETQGNQIISDEEFPW